MDTSRVLLYSPQDAFLGELAPADVFARTRIEEVNGEHSLSITTSSVLAKETRVLTCDATGAWREYVVVGEDAEHAGGRRAIGTYYAVWSLQHDLTGVRCDGEGSQPGVRTPVSAAVALAAAIHGTARWGVGTVTQTTTGGASMWRRSAWEALGILTKVWGGEIEPTITVGRSGVTSRAVNLYSRQGSASVTRRFDYSRDLTGIRRVVSEDPVYVRIVPLGKGEETEDGGVGRKIDISSVNGGVDYLEADAAIVQAFRLPDGSGGYEYPTCYAENTDCESPADLKAWGISVIGDYATPKVSYEASVLQLAAAGMDVQGIGLGDAVDVVDTAFGGEGVRISGRVLRLVTDELNPSHVEVTFGNLKPGLPDVFGALDATVRRTREAVEAMAGGNLSTAEYLSRLIDRLNAEINSTGGYTYITQGQGLRTYDAAVSDPLVGAEATKVVELKGGSIRIADSKTAQGAWNWKTLIVSGHIATELVTAAHLTTGYIGNATNGNYWNLDTGELRMASAGAKVDGQNINAYIGSLIPTPEAADAQAIWAELTSNGTLQGVWNRDGSLYINGTYIATGTIADQQNRNYWNLATGEISMQGVTDAISVGGANLLDDTDAPSLAKVAADSNRSWAGTTSSAAHEFVAAEDPPINGIDTAVRFTVSTASTNNCVLAYYTSGNGLALSDGETYTASCYARVVSGSAATVRMMTYNGTTYHRDAQTITGSGWERLSYTFEAGADQSPYARIMFGVQASNIGAVEICGMKLERGTLATDWAPSARDVAVESMNNAAAAVGSLDDELTQSEILARLTGGYTTEGLYITQDGHLYANATMLKAGYISASRLMAGSITADKIDASQLISPKVGNSAMEYAEIGNITYQGQAFTGIAFHRSGSGTGDEGTIVLGVNSDGSQMLLAIGLPGGYGYYPLYYGTQGAVFLNALPTLWHNVYSSYGIVVDSRGLTYTNGQDKTATIRFPS